MLTQCSDGVDNDSDNLIDAADPGCHSDGNASNNASYVPADNNETNGVQAPQCSDGVDNDADNLIDTLDPGCHSDGNANNPSSYMPYGNTESGGGAVLGASTGQVLGASCGLYMDKFIRSGKNNNVDQVKKLQTFLNKWMGSNLPVTGFYGPLTLAALNAFQIKYAPNVLTPWGLSGPTGIVYLTTLRWINMLECPDLALQLPALVNWSSNPSVPR